ncbi:MAG: radical SAM protein [Bacteroides sp.]|nr:radical SAM protein [Bacteroides sp.]
MNTHNYSIVPFSEGYLLVDPQENRYGKDKGLIFLNKEGLRTYNLLLENPIEKTVDILFSETSNTFSKEQITAAVKRIYDLCPSEKIPFAPIKATLTTKRQPLIGVIELTPICNCNCPHCYVKGFRDFSNWLKTDQFLQIAKIFREKGILNVTLTGGEPLMHPDFRHIYTTYKEYGFLVDIFSNALLIDTDLVEFFAEYPPRSMDITIYGTDDKEYYEFTGVKNGYTKLRQNLDLLHKYGIFFTTKMILNRTNYHKLADYNRIALDYNAPFRYNVIIGKGNNLPTASADLSLTAEQIIEVEAQDPLRKQIFNALANNCSNLPFDYNENHCPQFLCGAGLDKVFIGYDGIMAPCMVLRNKGLNLFKYGFDHIWSFWGKQRAKTLPQNFQCLQCEYLPICTPCTEEFEQLNGAKDRPIESRCKLAELRWNKYIKQ